jgi:lipooligosaccharide transport system permease protein
MEEIVMGEILWAATKSFIGVLGVVAVFIVLGVIKTWAFLFAIPVLMLLSLAFSAMAMVVTAYARDYDSFTYYFTLVVTPMSLLSGTFFPLTNFPVWAKAIAQVLPLSHGVRVTRAIFLGNWDPIYFASVGFLVVIFVACTNWSMSRIKRRLIY